MRAEMRWLDTNDFSSWEEFDKATRAEPLEGFGWFSCGIGADGEASTENFQLVVATPLGVPKAQQERRRLRLLVVEEFTRESIEKMLREHVSKITGPSWLEISNQLREIMYSEYESPKD